MLENRMGCMVGMHVSSKAIIGKALISTTAIVLGPSKIGDYTLIDYQVIIGYPTRSSIKKALEGYKPGNEDYYRLLDEVSKGAIIGSSSHIRPGSTVYEDVFIGDNVETGHDTVIREKTVVGNNTIIGSKTVIDGKVRIGSNVRIETGVYIPPESVIEDNVFLGPHSVITNDRYPPSQRLKGATIRRGAVIGANAVLIAGVEIGENSVVGSGSIVTRNVPPNTVVVGSPARPIMTREEYEEKKNRWNLEGAVNVYE